MKNIIEILSDLKIELTDDQKKKIDAEVLKNYKTIEDYNGQKGKLENAEQLAKDNKKSLEDFKKELEKLDVEDVEGLKKKFSDMEKTMESQKSGYETKIKEMTLESTLRSKASEYGCIDFDLAKSQIDMKSLLSSNDQSNDIKKAFDELKKSKPILFKEEEPKPKKKSTIIQQTEPDGKDKPLTMASALAEFYAKE